MINRLIVVFLTNIGRLLIVQFSFFIVAAVVVIYIFGLRNESLLFVVLIFGIYLIISGRVSQFKFMNLEVMMKKIESKQPEITEYSLSQPEVDPEYYDKGPKEKLETVIIPKLIRESKKVKILGIKKIENKNEHRYDQNTAQAYLRYFTHVVFIDNKMFCGFATADELLEKIKSSGQIFLNDINDWKLNSPIRNDVYILKGASRKQVLDRMKEFGITVLPVVSGGVNYEGVVDEESIISQITRDFYNYAKNPKEFPVL